MEIGRIYKICFAESYMNKWVAIALILAAIVVVGFISFKIYGNVNLNSNENQQENIYGFGSEVQTDSGIDIGSEDFENPADTETDTETASDSSPMNYEVDIGGFKFSPQTLTIKVGDSVAWTNSDSASHTATSDAGSEIDSPTLSNGQSYSHTFTTTGTFAYHCSFHSGMKGTIVVE